MGGGVNATTLDPNNGRSLDGFSNNRHVHTSAFRLIEKLPP